MTRSLSRDERWFARTLFQNRILRANGTAFQHLFWDVMRGLHGPEFVAVRPQGSRGDGGNDGYLPTKQHYFQVYGPIDPADRVTEAARKLSRDFERIKQEWGSNNQIRSFSFVFNDKYEGVFRDLSQAIDAVAASNPGVVCRPYSAAELENDFIELDDDNILRILGCSIPDPKAIRDLRYDVMNEVVRHILSTPAASQATRFGELPDLYDKIRLNNLSIPWAEILSAGARQSGHIDAYFARNSTFARQSLRDHVVAAYAASKEIVADVPANASLPRSDAVFVELRTRLSPPGASIGVLAVVDAIVGYFFEVCDIFDPRSPPGSPNASP